MDSPVYIQRPVFADAGQVGEVDDTLGSVAVGLRARWLLDAMSGLVGLLSPHGAVLELNECGLAAAGVTRAEAAGRKLWELDGWCRGDGARRRAQRAVVRVVARDAPTHLTLSLWPAAEQPRTFDIVLTPVHDRRGQVTLLILEGRDVTNLRTAEGATIRQNAELHELADQLSATDARRRHFIADVGHELKTPLSIAIGLLDRTLNESILPAPARRDVVEARQHAHSVQVQVDQLLTAARIEAGRLELVLVRCDLAELSRRVVAGFESVAAARGVSLEVDAPERAVVIADQQRVASAITNLVSNALKATPHGGSIRVELRERRRKARLEISDTGPGVPARVRDAIFERFRQGSAQRAGGSGIGLALVNEIVALHGGSISIETAPSGGALFRLEFGLAPKGATVVPLPDIQSAVGPSRERLRAQLSLRTPAATGGAGEPDTRPCILLVEDDVVLGMRLAEQLSLRYSVHHATSAEDALEQLQRGIPDLLVTDIVLPRMTGEALVEHLRSRPEYDHTAIVAVTGGTDPGIGERLLRLGAQDFMRKPLHEPELIARVEGVLRQRAQEKTARETAALAEASIAQAALGVGILAVDGHWLRANQMLSEMLGYSEQELRQMTLDEITAPEDIGIESSHLEAALDRQTGGFQVEKRLRRADGAYAWFLLSVAAIFRPGRPMRLVVHVTDAGERRAAEDALRRLEHYDEQTGLLRRREFDHRLRRHLRRLRGAGALLLVDVDDFASVNRRVGRVAGDGVLRAVGEAIRAVVPRRAAVGRVDGNRFGILVTSTDRAGSRAVAVAVVGAVADCAIEAQRTTVHVTVRVGGVMLSPGVGVDEVFAVAERALAKARHGGGIHLRSGVRRPHARGSRPPSPAAADGESRGGRADSAARRPLVR